MSNTLIHIALHVKERDINSFYLDVLHGRIERTFDLSKEFASGIFNINKDVKVVQVSCQGIDFELFIDDDPLPPTFAHVCFLSEQAKKIMERANQNGYSTCLHQNQSAETYFVRDANFNLFEIKKQKLAPAAKYQFPGVG
jgi:hypothetical protein